MKQTAIWENSRTFGAEYLEITTSGDHTIATSAVISVEEGSPIKVDYKIELNSWFTKTVKIEISNSEKSLYLETNANHQWFDQDGNERPELSGALDIDISCTPFTNTLPIKRMQWIIGQPQICQMVYIKVPELTLKKVEQIYTLIKDEKDYQVFDYKSPSYHAVIQVDKEGLVMDYPGLFIRKY